MSQDTTILHSLWRKALNSPVPVKITCQTKSDAVRLRWAMYNAVAKYRPDGPKHAQADADLREAIENCSLAVEGKDPGPFALVVQRKVITSLMQAVVAALGETPVLDTVTMAAKESEARVMSKLAGLVEKEGEESPDTRSTPYYTR